MTRRPAAFLVLLGLAAATWAADESQQVAAERARITAERARVDADFQAAQKACYQKFSVSGCIDDARARRATLLGDLRRQEISLNDDQRKARAADRLKELDQKQADEARKQAEAAARGAEQSASRERRVQENAAKAQERAAKAEGRTAKPRDTASGVAPGGKPSDKSAERAPLEKAPDTEESRRRFEQRQADAQEHKARVEKRAAEQQKKNKPVQPLSDPS